MTTSTWNVSTSGDWSDASDWSGGVPNSSTATATIAEAGSYTVDIAFGESFTVGSVTLNDANATLDIAGTLDLTNTLTLTAGTLELSGTINGGTIDTGGGTFVCNSYSGALNGVAVDGTINLNARTGSLTISGGLAMEGANGTGSGTIDLAGGGTVFVTGTESISNAVLDVGTNGPLSEISNEGSGVVTFASSTTIDAVDPFFNLVSNSGSYVNDGSISAQGYGIFYVQSADFTNAGSVTVSKSDWLEFDNTNFANSGTISVSNRSFMSIETTGFSNIGTISVDGTSAISFQTALTASQMGTVNVSSGATLDFTGTLNNAGATLVLPTNVSVGGTIDGGTIEGSFNIATIPPTEGQITPSLTLGGSPTLEGSGGTGVATITLTNPLFLSGTETIGNATINYLSSQGEIDPVGNGTVTFSSSVTINQPGDNDNYGGVEAYLGSYPGSPGTGSVINDGSINIGSGAADPDNILRFTIDPVSFTNAGTISVTNNSLLTLDPSSFSNTGLISVAANSITQFGLEVTTAQLGTLTLASGALVDFKSTLNNTGSTFTTATGVELSGTIDGGTIEGTLNVTGAPNYWGVDSSLTLTGNPTLKGAGGTGAATIDLGGYNALYFSGTETLSNATVNITNGGDSEIDVLGAGTLTIASHITLDQQNGSGGTTGTIYLGKGGIGTIINDGTINASGDAAYFATDGFFVDPASFTNAGTINVTGSDTLTLESANFNNTGTISVDGTSTIDFDFAATPSELKNISVVSGSTIDFAGTLDNRGSTYKAPGGAVLEGTIDGGQIDGTINVGGQTGLALADSPVLTGSGGSGAGTIVLAGQLTLTGTETIDNATIDIDNPNGGGIVNGGNGTVTLGSNLTISYSNGNEAGLGTNNYYAENGPVINDGTIDASAKGGQFYINSSAFNNNGTISVSNDGTLILNPGSFTNNGTISIDGTSTLQVDFAVTAAELGAVNAASGATLKFGELNNAGATYVVPTGVNLEGTIDGGKIEGTINLNGSGAQLYLSGVTMLGAGGSGPGTINVTGDNCILNLQGSGTFSNATINAGSALYYQPSNIYVSGALAPNVTIDQSAAGTYATLGGGGSNEGTINLSSNGGAFTLTNGPFTNTGTIAVSNGDTLDVGSFGYFETFINSGTVKIDGSSSSIDYWNPVSTADLGTIVASNGGVIDFSTILDNTGATFVVPAGATLEGTIQGGTIEGTLDVTYLPSLQFSLELTDSVTFEGQGGSGPGTLDLDGTLYLAGTETISDVTINQGKGPLFITGESDVTFASNVTFNNVSIEIQPFQAVPVQGTVVDDGSIIANTNGSTLTIEIPDFTNAGTISVTNGDTLYLESTNGPNSFINTGTISVDGTSTLEIDEAVTTAQLGTIDVSPGATIEFYGMLNNTGATFVMPTGTFVQGTVEGGTLEGNFNVTGDNPLQLSGTMTVANATIDVGAPSAAGAAIVNVGGGVVTIASTTTIEQTVTGTAAFLGDDANDPNAITSVGTVVVDGTIISAVSGSAFGIDPATLTVNGLLEAEGGKIAVGSNDFTNLSGTTLTGGSYEAAAGGTFEFVAFSTFTTDDATIILSGSSAIMEQLNLNTNALSTIESTLTSTGSGGTLEILGGANWTQSTAFTNNGTIQLGGGTFQVSSLAGSGTIDGFGTVGEAAPNASALIAQGGTLNVQDGSLSGYSGGTLTGVTLGAGANATLQLPGNVSITTLDGTIEFLGAGAAIQSSGLTVQSTLKTIGASGTLVVGDSYTSSNAISNAGTIAMAGGTLSTGTLTDSAGSNLNGYGTVASVFSDSGSVTSSGGALVFTGTGDTFAGSLGGQEIDFGGGTDSLQSAASLTAGTVAIYGNAAVTLGSNQTYAGKLNLGAGTLSLGANTLTLSGTGSTLAGTISGTNALTFSGGSQSIDSGASLSVSSWTLSGSDATTLNKSLSTAVTFSAGAGTTLTIASGDTLTLNGTSTLAGAIGGAGALTLSGGSQAFDSGASLATAHWSLAGSDAATLNENLTFGGTFAAAAATTLTIASGDTLTLNGTSGFAGKVEGATLAFAGGSQGVSAGAALDVSNWMLSGSADTTVGESLSFGGTFSAGAGTTLALVLDDTLTLTGSTTFAGSTSGRGILLLSGGTTTFDAGAHFGAAIGIHSAANVAVNGAVSVSSALTQSAGTTMTIGAGDTLTLSGSGSSLAGTINGTGTLAFAGGTASWGSGVTLGVSDLSLSSGVGVTLKTSLGYGGDLAEASGTTLALGAYTLVLSGAGTTIAGTVSGPGSLVLSGGSQAIDSGALLKESNWSMSNGDAASVDEDLTYSGTDSEGAGTTLTIATGDTVSLTGRSTLRSTLDGAGTISLSNATVSGLVVGGTVTLDDVGTVLQSGQVTLGDATSNAATVSIASGAGYEINANVGIGIGASPASVIDDNGLLIKNGGTGASKIAVGIVDDGHIEAATGTLDLVQAVTGSGAMKVDAGATLEIDASAASTLSLLLNGSNATLALASPSSFAATITDFAASDDIDLLKIKATSAVLENGDRLLITNGAKTVATLQLSGTYTGYTFNTVSDGHGGTDITATAPGGHTGIGESEYDAASLTSLMQNKFDAHVSDWHLI
jgi:fibronectin-binding autotransporter adhesin